MSSNIRTPFFPIASGATSTRPASRAATRQPDGQNLNTGPGNGAASSGFTVDKSNPLHSSSNAQPATSLPQFNAMPQPTGNAPPSTASTNTNGATTGKMNTSGLGMAMRKINNGVQNDQASRRSSGTTAQIPRPGTADPRSTNHPEQKLFNRRSINRETHATNLIAPVPVQASLPQLPLLADSRSFSGITAFKAPVLPVSAAQSDKNQTNDAHILTSAVEFSFKAPQSRPDIPSRQSISPEASTIPTSDTIAETDAPIETSAIKFSLANSVGPQRLLINRDGHYSQKQGELEPLSGHTINESGRIIKSVSGANKRSRDEMDDSDVEADLHRGQTAKRPKTQNSDDRRGRDEYSARSKVRSPLQSSPRQASEYSHPGESPEARTTSRSYHHQDGRSSTPVEEQYSYRPEHEHASPEPRLLDTLLGKDIDGYLKEHMNIYDRSVARWTECEMSEWVAGADEIAEKYGRILDFVKTHMTAKLKLYSGFHRKVDDHNIILHEREQVLTSARKRLVKESGNVLG